MASSPELAVALMRDAAGALPQQLRAYAQQLQEEQGLLDACCIPWLTLRLTHAPLPLMAPSEAASMAAAHGAPLLAVCMGVVSGVSTVGQWVVARRLTCACCTAACDVLEGARITPCCSTDVAVAREDVSQR